MKTTVGLAALLILSGGCAAEDAGGDDVVGGTSAETEAVDPAETHLTDYLRENNSEDAVPDVLATHKKLVLAGNDYANTRFADLTKKSPEYPSVYLVCAKAQIAAIVKVGGGLCANLFDGRPYLLGFVGGGIVFGLSGSVGVAVIEDHGVHKQEYDAVNVQGFIPKLVESTLKLLPVGPEIVVGSSDHYGSLYYVGFKAQAAFDMSLSRTWVVRCDSWTTKCI